MCSCTLIITDFSQCSPCSSAVCIKGVCAPRWVSQCNFQLILNSTHPSVDVPHLSYHSSHLGPAWVPVSCCCCVLKWNSRLLSEDFSRSKCSLNSNVETVWSHTEAQQYWHSALGQGLRNIWFDSIWSFSETIPVG